MLNYYVGSFLLFLYPLRYQAECLVCIKQIKCCMILIYIHVSQYAMKDHILRRLESYFMKPWFHLKFQAGTGYPTTTTRHFPINRKLITFSDGSQDQDYAK